MNRILVLVLSISLIVPTFAQFASDYTNYEEAPKEEKEKEKEEKNCSSWLPKAGDWNIQVGMSPTAIVMGGKWSQVGGFSFGYMVTDKIGIKASVGLDLDLWNTRKYAQDDAAIARNAFSKEKIVDTRKHTSFGGTFSLGADFHVGSEHKVQGVFGVGVMYGVKALDKYVYTYNNAITEYNQIPSTNLTLPDGTTTVWALFPAEATGISYGRVIRQYEDNGHRQMVGLYLSAGLEWFVTPKLALGLNANFDIMYQFMHAYTTEYEGWSNFEKTTVKWTEKEQPQENGFALSTNDMAGLKIYMSVYL